MNYYILDSLGEYDDKKYCHNEEPPEGLDDIESALEYGGDLSSEYPGDPYEVEVHLDDDSPKHIKLGSFISTTDDYVMVREDVVEELKKYNIGEVDFWPFSLINHKGKVHSKDYRFVVPRKQFDALDEKNSEIDRDANGIVIGIDKVVLSSEKIKTAPDMFRVNDLGVMGFSKTLVKKLESEFTNFVFEKVEIN